MFRDAIDHTHKNLDPSKWTKAELDQVIAAFEREHPEAAAVEGEAAIREVRGTKTVQ